MQQPDPDEQGIAPLAIAAARAEYPDAEAIYLTGVELEHGELFLLTPDGPAPTGIGVLDYHVALTVRMPPNADTVSLRITPDG